MDGAPMTEGLSCFCTLDQDGECVSCKSEMVSDFKAALPEFTKLMEKISKEDQSARHLIERAKIENKHQICAPCEECNLRYIDLIMSGFIPLMGNGTPMIAEAFTQGIVETCTKAGVKAMPLTIRAWQELRCRKGWL